jgi:hypothetical protein
MNHVRLLVVGRARSSLWHAQSFIGGYHRKHFGVQSDCVMNLASHLRLMLRLRMSGALPPLLLGLDVPVLN